MPDVAPAATAFGAASSAGLVRNFNGVSSLDSAVTNFGAEFEPPDQGLCVGNGFVLEPVNSAFRVYRENGRSVAGPTNVNALFGDGFKQFTSDPRCQYDPATHTWFASIVFLNDTFTASRLEIAVRHAADPRGTWTHFKINTTHPGGHGCPCFGDQPLLGIDDQNIYISTNEFSINGPQFNGAQLYVIDKRQLVDGDASPTFVHIGPLRIGDHEAASVQPAITVGPSRAEYLMSSLDPKGAGDNRIGVWAVTNRVLGTHPDPHLQRIIIPSQAYSTPPATPQLGSQSRIDSGDDRMQQVQAIGGRLWGELGTALRTGGGKPVAAAAWFDVAPSLDRRPPERHHQPPGLRLLTGQRHPVSGDRGRPPRKRGDGLLDVRIGHVPQRRLRDDLVRSGQLRAADHRQPRHRAVLQEVDAVGRLLLGGARPGRTPCLAGQRVHPAPVEPDRRRPPELGDARLRGAAAEPVVRGSAQPSSRAA